MLCILLNANQSRNGEILWINHLLMCLEFVSIVLKHWKLISIFASVVVQRLGDTVCACVCVSVLIGKFLAYHIAYTWSLTFLHVSKRNPSSVGLCGTVQRREAELTHLWRNISSYPQTGTCMPCFAAHVTSRYLFIQSPAFLPNYLRVRWGNTQFCQCRLGNFLRGFVFDLGNR